MENSLQLKVEHWKLSPPHSHPPSLCPSVVPSSSLDGATKKVAYFSNYYNSKSNDTRSSSSGREDWEAAAAL